MRKKKDVSVVIEPWAQHRSEIHWSIICVACKKRRVAYSPDEEYSKLEAYCGECAAERHAQIRKTFVKSFKAAERWLIDPSKFQKKP